MKFLLLLVVAYVALLSNVLACSTVIPVGVSLQAAQWSTAIDQSVGDGDCLAFSFGTAVDFGTLSVSVENYQATSGGGTTLNFYWADANGNSVSSVPQFTNPFSTGLASATIQQLVIHNPNWWYDITPTFTISFSWSSTTTSNIAQVSALQGIATGGTTLTLMGTSLGSGSDITSVTVDGVAASIIAQTAASVTVVTGNYMSSIETNGVIMVASASCGVNVAPVDFEYVGNRQTGSVCNDEGSYRTFNLVCPSTSAAPCAYYLQVTGNNGNADYVVFATASDFAAYQNDQPYNYVAQGLQQPQDVAWDSGWFTVAPGGSLLFATYNWNWIESQSITVEIETYPNATTPADVTIGGAPAPQFSSDAKYFSNQYAQFVIGVIAGFYDEKPYQVPTACISAINSDVLGVENLIAQVTSGSIENVISAIESMYTSVKTTLSSCQPVNCDSFLQEVVEEIADRALDVAEDASGLKIVVDAGKLAEAAIDGYDAVTDFRTCIDNWPINPVVAGVGCGNAGRNIRAAISNVESVAGGKRRVAQTTSTSTAASHTRPGHYARYPPGQRSVEAWQQLYNEPSLRIAVNRPVVPPILPAAPPVRIGLIAGVSSAAGVVVVAILAVALLCYRRRQARKTAEPSASGAVRLLSIEAQ